MIVAFMILMCYNKHIGNQKWERVQCCDRSESRTERRFGSGGI